MSMERRIRKANEEFMAKIDLDPAFYPAYEQGLPAEIYESYKADLPGDKQYWLNIIEEILHDAKNDYTRAVQESIEVIPGISELYKVETYIRYHYNKRGINKLGATQLHPVFKVQNTYDGSVNIFHTVNALAEYIEAERDKMTEVQKTAADNKGRTRISAHMLELSLLPSDKRREQAELFFEQPGRSTAGLELKNRKGAGITYTRGESQLVNALQDMLWERIMGEGYGMNSRGALPVLGETVHDVVAIRNEDGIERRVPAQIQAPVLGFTLAEIAKRQKGKDRVGGRDIQEVREIVEELADNPEKKPLIYYQTITKRQKKEIRETYSYHRPLVELVNRDIEIVDRETGEVDEKNEMLVILNPIFMHQLNQKMVFRPNHINQLLADANKKAHGTRQVSQVTDGMYRELLHQKAQNTGSKDKRVYRIGHDKLVDKIAPSYRGRIKQTLQHIDKAVETLKELGLILEYQRETGAGGRPRMHTFTLNREH